MLSDKAYTITKSLGQYVQMQSNKDFCHTPTDTQATVGFIGGPDQFDCECTG